MAFQLNFMSLNTKFPDIDIVSLYSFFSTILRGNSILVFFISETRKNRIYSYYYGNVETSSQQWLFLLINTTSGPERENIDTVNGGIWQTQ